MCAHRCGHMGLTCSGLHRQPEGPISNLGEQTQANPSVSEDQKVIVLYSSPKQVLQEELVRVTGFAEVSDS